MKFTAAFTHEELVRFISEWLPLKLLLGDLKKEDRYLLLSDPTAIELIPGQGLRVACRAQIRWPIMGLTVPITARELSVLLRPGIETPGGQPALVFGVQIERADLSAVPARLDTAITEALNRALAERAKLKWEFGRMLSRSVPLPLILTTTDSIDLLCDHGVVQVSQEGFTFELAMRASTTPRVRPG